MKWVDILGENITQGITLTLSAGKMCRNEETISVTGSREVNNSEWLLCIWSHFCLTDTIYWFPWDSTMWGPHLRITGCVLKAWTQTLWGGLFQDPCIAPDVSAGTSSFAVQRDSINLTLPSSALGILLLTWQHTNLVCASRNGHKLNIWNFLFKQPFTLPPGHICRWCYLKPTLGYHASNQIHP